MKSRGGSNVQELVDAAQNGDHDALIQLLRSIESPLYRTAFYLLRNEQDALDVTQEALLKIYRNINAYEQKAQFMTWAQKIVSNLCIDQLRKRKPTVSVDEHEHLLNEYNDNHVEKTFEQSLLKKDVYHAIHKLPDHQREVVLLRYIHDYSYKEVAHILNMPINTVKSHLFRARTQLSKLLSDNYDVKCDVRVETKGGASHDM